MTHDQISGFIFIFVAIAATRLLIFLVASAKHR